MSTFHVVGYTLEYKEEDNDKTNKMRPYVASLVMQHKQRFCYFLRRFVVESIAAMNMLIISDKVRSFLYFSQIGLRAGQTI